jgi:hypothetical protein
MQYPKDSKNCNIIIDKYIHCPISYQDFFLGLGSTTKRNKQIITHITPMIPSRYNIVDSVSWLSVINLCVYHPNTRVLIQIMFAMILWWYCHDLYCSIIIVSGRNLLVRFFIFVVIVVLFCWKTDYIIAIVYMILDANMISTVVTLRTIDWCLIHTMRAIINPIKMR